MTIEKLTEFAKTGQKNTDDLDLETGFIVNRKPARQWFNWLFSTLTTKINEIIDADFMPKSDVIDNLTTDDAAKPVSAKQAKVLQDNKLDNNANAVSASKLETSRQVSFSGAATGSFNFDGSAGTSCTLTLANSGAAAGTYGTTLKIPIVTVNAKGLISTITTQDIPTASTEQKGLVQLNNTLTSSAINLALTAAQGKALADKMFGVDQGWKNITATTVLNTEYTNTNPKTIFVIGVLNGDDQNVTLAVRNNDGEVLEIKCGAQPSSPGDVFHNVSAPIAPGESYKFSRSAGTLTIWMFS